MRKALRLLITILPIIFIIIADITISYYVVEINGWNIWTMLFQFVLTLVGMCISSFIYLLFNKIDELDDDYNQFFEQR